jgi:hypothetical protein
LLCSTAVLHGMKLGTIISMGLDLPWG